MTDPDYSFQPSEARRILAALKLHRRVLYVLPTGGGKTRIASMLVQQWVRAGRRVLILVHRRELLEQMYRTLTKAIGIDKDLVGVIWRDDERTNAEAPIQVASIDTAIRRKRFPKADYVIPDEAHHGVAAKWQRVFGWYPEAKILGLTATPMRFDGKPLGDAFDHMIVGPSVAQLIDWGVLMKPRCFVRPGARSIEISGLRVKMGDYDRAELERRSRRKDLVGNIVKHVQQHAQGRTIIAFAAGVKHAEDIARRLNAAKIKSVVVTGKTSERKRRRVLDPGGLLDKARIRAVVTCDLIGEGYDLPGVGVIVLARKTRSEALHLHQCGRVLRILDGKPAPIILDHAGNISMHGSPADEARDWSLDGVRKAPGLKDAPKARACAACGWLGPIGATVCEECGQAFPPFRTPGEIEAELVELSDAARIAARKKSYARVIRERIRRIDKLAGEELEKQVAFAVGVRFGEGASHA